MLSAVPPKRYGDRFLSVSLAAQSRRAFAGAGVARTHERAADLSAAPYSSSTLALSATTRPRVPVCTSMMPLRRRHRNRQFRPAGRRSRSNERLLTTSHLAVRSTSRRRREQQTLLSFHPPHSFTSPLIIVLFEPAPPFSRSLPLGWLSFSVSHSVSLQTRRSISLHAAPDR